ncbi:hypothetical protein GALMADRAFT_222708 [Galerina marginata CBS 339.88]|uniref:Uncharacterized protein n=1 Tax=Galerina marginata (strain CBS 339.88) TaxID=685588 RepID=A0A067TQG0_GALM3|nr:hypothetical protein GALMADRAFT_222708 [Galerina marginata CBS 339.88]
MPPSNSVASMASLVDQDTRTSSHSHVDCALSTPRSSSTKHADQVQQRPPISAHRRERSSSGAFRLSEPNTPLLDGFDPTSIFPSRTRIRPILRSVLRITHRVTYHFARLEPVFALRTLIIDIWDQGRWNQTSILSWSYSLLDTLS